MSSQFPPHSGENCELTGATSEEDGRKGDVPGIFVTRFDIGEGSVSLPCPSREDPSTLPTDPAVPATATACPGRGRDGPSLSRATASPGTVPSRAPASSGSILSRPRTPR